MTKWFCAQIGAREHYAVARALFRAGRLQALYTDFWAGRCLRSLSAQISSASLRSMAGRFHPELVGAPVKAWNLRSLNWEAGLRYRWCQNPAFGAYPGYIEVGRRFASRVREALKNESNTDSHSIFFAYDTGALESMEWCRERGIRCVLNQMDPGRVEVDLVCEESKRWPGWQAQSVEVPEAYFQRREQEWSLADRVVVNSEFSRQALIQQGVPAAKLVVVPLCYEAEGNSVPVTASGSRPLRVLWLGQVILRKGIQYLLEAARLLRNVHFDIAGPIGISKTAVASAPANVIFHGRATRDQASAWYRQADVFVLPTLSDGFALTQLEAMSHGVPVIATPCCGAVVSDGLDGFIVPPRDSKALAQALQRYLDEPDLLQSHKAAALKKSRQFTVDHLGANLLSLGAHLTV